MLKASRRRILSALAGAVLISAVGCTGVGPLDPNAPIGVVTSNMMITVENRAGLALNNVSVAIQPAGRATEFTTFVGRMENATKRDLMLGQFRGSDGTPFNLRVVRPRAVVVSGEDLNGETYEVIAPWD